MSFSFIKKQFIVPFFIIITILYASKVLNRYYNPYLYPFLLHPLIQFFIVIISTIIFILGILSFWYCKSGILYMIGLLFFITGTFEFFHMLTHLGMLSYISKTYLPTTYWFEILSDLVGSIGSFFILLFQKSINVKYQNANKYKVLFVISLFTFMSAALLLLFSGYLPQLILGTENQTLRKALIYITIFFNAFNIFTSTYYYFKSKRNYYIHFSNGFILLLAYNIFFY